MTAISIDQKNRKPWPTIKAAIFIGVGSLALWALIIWGLVWVLS